MPHMECIHESTSTARREACLQKVCRRSTTLEAMSSLEDAVEGAPSVVAQTYYADAWGSYNMTWSKDGRCHLELKGFGTTELVRRMCDEADEVVSRFDPNLELRALADMRRGLGCSPFAFSRSTRLLRETGPRWVQALVVAPGPIASIADLSMRLARIQGVRFFGDKDK